MKKSESLFLGVGLALILGVAGTVLWRHYGDMRTPSVITQPMTKYGAFLASLHAIYVNDFDRAAEYGQHLSDVDFATVTSTRYMAEFLSGHLPIGAELLKEEKAIPSQLIYEAYLLKSDNWADVYKRHKKDTSTLSAPMRIWSSVATGNVSDALAFVDGLPTNKSWKDFVRGQIYAETGKIDDAVAAFDLVRSDFMNISDYLYLMSFYRYHGMNAQADALKTDFASRPGGLYMLEYDAIPDWSVYSGYKNELAFSLVQNVSHNQVMMYSDLAMLWLRFAQITGPDFGTNNSTIDYYIGQYFYLNGGNWRHHFDRIESNSPFYPFAVLRRAEQGGKIRDVERVVRKNPLFVPAINNVVTYHTQHGNRRAALRVLNRALDNKKLTGAGRAYFLKSRALVYYTFGQYDAAQADLHEASKTLMVDTDIISLQAKIWAAQNREIENAYEYAMTLVGQNPADIMAWDTVGRVILVREGAPEALDLIVRVGNVATTCSSLFELLGDLYVQTGQGDLARDAYTRAIDLSDDGLVIVPVVQKKLRNIK